MSSKNVNKPKKTKIPIEQEYPLLSLEEMKIKEYKYNNRIMELTKCLNFIDDALQEISFHNNEQLLQDKWLDFVTCNPLPKPYIPPDIRLFYSKMKYFENENIENTINWLLSVNERSLLTQDIYRQDLSYRKLNNEIKENIGQEYNGYVKDSLNILQKIEYFLDNDVEVAKCPLSIFHDIVERKLFIQEEIMDLMDRYTYRIISSENSQMKSIDAISAEYCFKADNYQIHIWCLKNVALRISHLSEPRLLANFHSINLLLHIPSKMLKEKLVIRALHMDFDHLSEGAKSYKQTITFSIENLNAGIIDLHECLINEWIMQLEVQAKIRDEMIQKHLEYEEKMRQYEEEMERKKSSKKEDKKTKIKLKIVKPTKEPINLGNDRFPDTYEEFLKEEQKQYEIFIQSVYRPELLNLSADEINLKKYFILGGIYQLYYVEKPIHYDFNSFNMTWHQNESKLVVNKNVSISLLADAKRVLNEVTNKPQIDTGKRLTKLMSIFEAQNKNIATDAECPWFILTIELPEYLCYWDEPIACHFETVVETREQKEEEKVENLSTMEIVKNKQDIKKIKDDENSFKTEIAKSPAIETSQEKSLDSFLHLQNRLSYQQRKSRGSFFKSSLANSLLDNTKHEQTPKDGTSTLIVNDFPLTYTLTKLQIRHMERHIIPRIISSYKFPKEIRLEELELYNKKPKGKGGKIIRQRNIEYDCKLSNRQFTFNTMQNNAERLFAIYPKVEPLHIVSYLKELHSNVEQEEPQTFAQLLQIVSNIKKKYRLRLHQTLDLKPFDTQIQTHNKRIRQMQRKKELLALNLAAKETSINNSRSTITSRKNSKRKSLKTEMKSKLSFSSKQTDKETINTTEVLVETEDNKTNYSFEENLIPKDNSSEIDETVAKDNDTASYTYSHWTTKYILKSEFDRENRKIIVYTNRLGNFGFAFKRYEHFPFKYWSMEPSANDPNNEVVFTLDTQYVRCVLYITANGIRGHVTESTKTYVRNPKMYLVIENPLKDYKEFKKFLKAKHLNIFAEHDASFYIDNGYFSEKHLSNEMHTYCCMSIHSTQMRFNFSQWNRLAKRRDIILYFQHYQDTAENLVQVRITPGEAFFVEVQELCSEDLNVIKLDYNLTWRNIESYSDLHHLIVAMYPAATELRCKNPKLICFIRDLLSEIRPLSFS